MLLAKRKGSYVSYVGYTSNLESRLKKHNNSKGAKFTKGSVWKLIYSKEYLSKRSAMKDEYNLKKDYKLRSKLKTKFINEKRYIHNFTL